MLSDAASAATIDFVGVTPESPSCPTTCVAQGYNIAWDASGILSLNFRTKVNPIELLFKIQDKLFSHRNTKWLRTNARRTSVP
jgi:hypothetical protein